MIRGVIWYLFWKFEPKLKNFLRLSYLIVTTPSFLKNCFETFFNDDSKREKFIKFNSSEQVKGQDCLNYQKARFYHLLFEAFGIEMVNHFVPYLQIFCSSTEECEQICASEIVAGLMRGKYLTYISFSSSNTQFFES